MIPHQRELVHSLLANDYLFFAQPYSASYIMGVLSQLRLSSTMKISGKYTCYTLARFYLIFDICQNLFIELL